MDALAVLFRFTVVDLESMVLADAVLLVFPVRSGALLRLSVLLFSSPPLLSVDAPVIRTWPASLPEALVSVLCLAWLLAGRFFPCPIWWRHHLPKRRNLHIA